jgi:hypothetical protein
MKRNAHYYVVPVDGHQYPDARQQRLTLMEARKLLAKEAKEARQDCINAYKRCSIVGKAKSGFVEIKVGGKQGYHVWTRLAIRDHHEGYPGTQTRRKPIP